MARLDGLGGVGVLAFDLNIQGNASLTDLTGLAMTRAIDVTITHNPSLKNIEGLANLTSALGEVTIYNNRMLDNVEGLRNLERAEVVTIINPITTLAGLRKLTGVYTLSLQQTRLTNLQGLGALVFDESGTFELQQNALLTSLAGLGAQTARLGSLNIMSNAQLQDLAGFEGLTRVSQSIQVTGNGALTSMHGLENLTFVDNLYNARPLRTDRQRVVSARTSAARARPTTRRRRPACSASPARSPGSSGHEGSPVTWSHRGLS